MANWHPNKDLWEEVTCPICLELCNDPIMLKCGHNFCRPCFFKQWQPCDRDATCPVCLQNSIMSNLKLEKIVELVKKLRTGEGPEGKCEKIQKLHGEDDRAVCVVCDRFKKNRAHAVLSEEKAFRDHKASCSEFGTQSMADLPKLFEHFQQQGLSIGSLSGEDLRILLIQHTSQPDPESAKVKAKQIQPQQQEHKAQEGCDPKEKEPFRVLEKTGEEQVAAQAQLQKSEWECRRQRNTQQDENIPGPFPFAIQVLRNLLRQDLIKDHNSEGACEARRESFKIERRSLQRLMASRGRVSEAENDCFE